MSERREWYTPQDRRLVDWLDRLFGVVHPARVPEWLVRTVPALDGRRPIDLLIAGQLEDLEELVSGLESGSFT